MGGNEENWSRALLPWFSCPACYRYQHLWIGYTISTKKLRAKCVCGESKLNPSPSHPANPLSRSWSSSSPSRVVSGHPAKEHMFPFTSSAALPWLVQSILPLRRLCGICVISSREGSQEQAGRTAYRKSNFQSVGGVTADALTYYCPVMACFARLKQKNDSRGTTTRYLI